MADGRRIHDAAPAFCAILYTEGDGVEHDRSFNFDAASLDVGPQLDDPGAQPEPPEHGPSGGGSEGPDGPGEGPAGPSAVAHAGVVLWLVVAIAGVALAALLWTTQSGAAVALGAGGLWALVAMSAPRPDSRLPPRGAP